MADETTIGNGVVVSDGVDDNKASKFVNIEDENNNNNNDAIVSDLSDRIEGLEKEKIGLIRENQERIEKIRLLMDEIDGLKKNQVEMNTKFEDMQTQIHQSEHYKTDLQAVSARVVELETEVSRLQHELIDSVSGSEETVSELKRELEDSKQNNLENERKISSLEKEKEEERKSVRELEEKIKAIEGNISLEKESGIVALDKEKKETESAKSVLEEALKQSEGKLREMEKKVNELESELQELKRNSVEVNERECVMNGKEDALRLRKGGLEGIAWLGTGAAAIAIIGFVGVHYIKRSY